MFAKNDAMFAKTAALVCSEQMVGVLWKLRISLVPRSLP